MTKISPQPGNEKYIISFFSIPGMLNLSSYIRTSYLKSKIGDILEIFLLTFEGVFEPQMANNAMKFSSDY